MKMFALALAVMLPCLAAGPGGKSMGNPAAPLRMDLWDDFTCPHCKMLHEQILPRIIADYVTPGKAYLVFHEFTLTGLGHEHSKTASTYAAAAAYVEAVLECSCPSPVSVNSWKTRYALPGVT